MRKMIAVVVYRDDKYLVLRRKLNWKGWEFVKGEVEREGFKHAVLREMTEELGVKKARVVYKIPAEIIYSHEDIRGHKTSMQVAYLVKFAGGRIRISREHSGFKWATFKQAVKLLTYDTHKTFLKLADEYLRKQKILQRKKLIETLSKKHVTLVRFDGKTIKLKYDGAMLLNKAVRKTVKVVGDWSRKHNIVFYDRNLDEPGVLPILVHETVEKHVAQAYGLDVDTEAHKIAQAVEKEFVADKKWIALEKIVSRAWVKANKQKVGKSKFY